MLCKPVKNYKRSGRASSAVYFRAANSDPAAVLLEFSQSRSALSRWLTDPQLNTTRSSSNSHSLDRSAFHLYYYWLVKRVLTDRHEDWIDVSFTKAELRLCMDSFSHFYFDLVLIYFRVVVKLNYAQQPVVPSTLLSFTWRHVRLFRKNTWLPKCLAILIISFTQWHLFVNATIIPKPDRDKRDSIVWANLHTVENYELLLRPRPHNKTEALVLCVHL